MARWTWYDRRKRAMADQKVSSRGDKELREAILQEKAKGTPDVEIGRKYGVTFRYIERVITKSQGVNVSSLAGPKSVKTVRPRHFVEEQTTVWSFKSRGAWATHSGEYRGNWSPYIPRNLILKYSNPGDTVLDHFCGAGTTAIECKLLGRRCIALDINARAIDLAKRNTDFNLESQQLTFDDGSHTEIYDPELRVGDARDLSFLSPNSVDLICAHPPYADIIHYTDCEERDLSFCNVDDFLEEMTAVAKESYRVLKPGRQCAILIGDMRRRKHVVPLGFRLINVYLDAGFRLRELVIKRQHNCKTTGFWYANSIRYNFLLLAHEYLPVFEKPMEVVPSGVTERAGDYDLLVPVLEKPPLKRKLDGFETTTVWIFSGGDFEKRLNKNVIDRYSGGKKYSTVRCTRSSENQMEPAQWKPEGMQLLFVKSPWLSDTYSQPHVDGYLTVLKGIVNRDLSRVNSGGCLVVQTQDMRTDGYIEPVAKRVVDSLKSNDLWLKEIIVVTRTGREARTQPQGGDLEIAHQYLIVYEKVEGGGRD